MKSMAKLTYYRRIFINQKKKEKNIKENAEGGKEKKKLNST